MSIERYETYRQSMTAIHMKAVSWAMKKGNLLQKVGRKLGMVASDGTFLFEDEEDTHYLSDAMLYESTVDGVRTISTFFKEHPPKDGMESEVRDAMSKACFGLFRVESANPEYGEVALRGLVAEVPDLILNNLALSETATPGLILATRVLPLPGLNISTGAYFPFEPEKEKRLVRDWWSKQGLERFALFIKLYRRSSGILFESF